MRAAKWSIARFTMPTVVHRVDIRPSAADRATSVLDEKAALTCRSTAHLPEIRQKSRPSCRVFTLSEASEGGVPWHTSSRFEAFDAKQAASR